MSEPAIIINGCRLTKAQAMLVRVAVSSFNPDCGDDAHGRAMTKAYEDVRQEVLKLEFGADIKSIKEND